MILYKYGDCCVKFRERVKQLKTDIPTIFLSLRDNETPFIAKILAGITIMYSLSPIDLIPDFIPVLGYIDDIIILPLLVGLTIRFIPKEILERNREKSKNLWQHGKPKKWYYAIPIVVIWCVFIAIVFFMIFK